MRIETRLENGRTVLYLHGKVTIGVGNVKFKKAIQELLDQGTRNILVDLGDVTTIDSSGIGELVAAFTDVTNAGGDLKLRRLPPKIQDVINNTNFPNFPNFPGGFAY